MESKKALCSPIILVLLLLFSGWNIFVIKDSSYFREELTIVNELVDDGGISATDESLEKLKHNLEPELAQLNKISDVRTGETFDQAAEFFNYLTFDRQEHFLERELQSFYDLYLKEMYVNVAETMDEAYQSLDIKKIGEHEIENFELTGAAAETYRNEYARFSDRFDEMVASGEHKQWFFFGKQYFMHSLLFKTVFIHLVIESLILVVLATALISSYEFENRSQLVVYSTKKGRRVMVDKLIASLSVTSILTLSLFAITLGTYFVVFDYTEVWKTSINSGFNWEYNFPYVSWWDLSLSAYLLLGIGLLFICMLLLSVFSFCISVWLKNSYVTFIFFATIFIGLLTFPGYIPGSTNLIFLAGFNLSILLLSPHQWWMGSSGLTMFKYYELSTVIVWSIIYTIICFLSLKRFRKQDIH